MQQSLAFGQAHVARGGVIHQCVFTRPTGMYKRLTLPGEKTRTYMHVFNTVGSTRAEPDPALMIYSISPQDEEVEAAWFRHLQGSSVQHPLLLY